MTKKGLLVVIVLALLRLPASAQQTFHVFPQVADGVFSDGTYYRSTFMILPSSDTDIPVCNLRFFPLSVTLNGITASNFPFTIPAGGSYNSSTAGNTQFFRSGYSTATCSTPVHAQTLYSFYAANNVKIAEATVFSSTERSSAKMIVDYREGARLGVAIANTTDLAHTYTFTLGSNSASFLVPSHITGAKFVDELMSVPAGTTGILKIQSDDFSQFAAIGLRFTGAVFTTIPAN
jgi:hypothetical protein